MLPEAPYSLSTPEDAGLMVFSFAQNCKESVRVGEWSC